MRKRKAYRDRLSFLQSLEQPQTLMGSGRAHQAVSTPSSLGPRISGSPLPLCCGTALRRVPSSSPPGGARTHPAATFH